MSITTPAHGATYSFGRHAHVVHVHRSGGGSGIAPRTVRGDPCQRDHDRHIARRLLVQRDGNRPSRQRGDEHRLVLGPRQRLGSRCRRSAHVCAARRPRHVLGTQQRRCGSVDSTTTRRLLPIVVELRRHRPATGMAQIAAGELVRAAARRRDGALLGLRQQRSARRRRDDQPAAAVVVKNPSGTEQTLTAVTNVTTAMVFSCNADQRRHRRCWGVTRGCSATAPPPRGTARRGQELRRHDTLRGSPRSRSAASARPHG